MAQDFNMRYPLVDGQGNFGSVEGDSPAAMRYTEARFSKIAVEMMRDIDANTVDWMPNYDETRREPTVLPSRMPNLMVNGASGIAVGMATNIPPHNLGEVVDAIVHVHRPSRGHAPTTSWSSSRGPTSPPAASSSAPRASRRPIAPAADASASAPRRTPSSSRAIAPPSSSRSCRTR